MADRLFGTEWKLTPEKSLFSAGFSPTDETRRYEELKNGYTLTVRGAGKGARYEWTYTAYYDGKAHPVRGRDDVDSIVISKEDERTTSGWFLKNGETVAAYKRKLEAEGLVVTAGGRRPDGSTYFDTIRYVDR